MKILRYATTLALVLFSLSCSDGIVSELPGDNVEIRAEFKSIQKNVFDAYCISCHAGQYASGGLDLSSGNSYNNLVNKLNAAGDQTFVSPGASEKSYIISRLTADNSQIMPPTGAIESHLIDTLKVWINNGALNN